MAFKLRELEVEYGSILCLCPIEDWAWIRDTYREQPQYVPPEPLSRHPSLHRVDPPTLYFALCELPFITELYERRRSEARSDLHLSVDGIKELLLEARRLWIGTRQPEIEQESN